GDYDLDAAVGILGWGGVEIAGEAGLGLEGIEGLTIRGLERVVPGSLATGAVLHSGFVRPVVAIVDSRGVQLERLAVIHGMNWGEEQYDALFVSRSSDIALHDVWLGGNCLAGLRVEASPK